MPISGGASVCLCVCDCGARKNCRKRERNMPVSLWLCCLGQRTRLNAIGRVPLSIVRSLCMRRVAEHTIGMSASERSTAHLELCACNADRFCRSLAAIARIVPHVSNITPLRAFHSTINNNSFYFFLPHAVGLACVCVWVHIIMYVVHLRVLKCGQGEFVPCALHFLTLRP